jgi:predicted nucleotidyltransferase
LPLEILSKHTKLWQIRFMQDVAQWLCKVAQTVQRATGSTRVILFGSRVQGSASHSSDADLCIVVPDGTDLRAVSIQAQRAVRDRLIPLDFVFIPHSDLESRGTILAREIMTHGRDLLPSAHGQ